MLIISCFLIKERGGARSLALRSKYFITSGPIVFCMFFARAEEKLQQHPQSAHFPAKLSNFTFAQAYPGVISDVNRLSR